MSQFKRGGHLVNSRVQRAVLWRFIFHWLALVATFFGVVCTLHFLLGDPGQPSSKFWQDLWHRYSLLIVVMASVVPYFLYDLIKLTHRFAGPMVRFGNALHRAAQGEAVEPIHFRKGDYWQELADDFNAVMAQIPRDRRNAEAILLAVEKEQLDEAKSPEDLVTI